MPTKSPPEMVASEPPDVVVDHFLVEEKLVPWQIGAFLARSGLHRTDRRQIGALRALLADALHGRV